MPLGDDPSPRDRFRPGLQPHLAHACGTGQGTFQRTLTRSPETTSAVHDRRKRRHSPWLDTCARTARRGARGMAGRGRGSVSPGQPLVRLHPISDHSEGGTRERPHQGAQGRTVRVAPRAATDPRVLSPTTRSARPSIHPTSGLENARESSNAAGPVTTRPSPPCPPPLPKALAAAGLASQDIDVIIVATCTHPYQTPTAASRSPA